MAIYLRDITSSKSLPPDGPGASYFQLVKRDRQDGQRVREVVGGMTNDTTIEYFPVRVAKRGLGIPSVRWMSPLQRPKKLIATLPHHNIGDVENSYLARETALCTRRLTCEDGNVIDSMR